MRSHTSDHQLRGRAPYACFKEAETTWSQRAEPTDWRRCCPHPRALSVLFVTSQSSGIQTCTRVSAHFLRSGASKQSSLAGGARWPGGDAGHGEKTFTRLDGCWALEGHTCQLPTAVNECETLFHLPTATSVRLIFKWKFCHDFFFFFLTFSFSSSWKLNSWLKTAALIVLRRFCRFLHVSPLILWSVRLSYGALKLSENMAFIKARLSCQRIQTSAAFVRRRRKWKFVIERNQ